MSKLQNNITSLQSLLEQVNALPEAGGVELPELQNEGTAADLLSGKELIDGEGNVVTGTIATKTAANLTANGAVVTVPVGYYASDATKSVATTTQATPSISIDSAGKITASATQTAGYVSAGTKTSTHQLAFQPAKTITPTTASQIAVSSGYYTGGNVTVAGDSNLLAENIKSGVSIFGVSGNYVGSGGDTSLEDSVITRTISSYTNDRVTSIGNYAFCSCRSLTTVSFPVATSIGNYAFCSCTSLTTVSFPVATYIGISAFYNCTSLTTVSFPDATSISSYAFYYCTSLTTVSFPAATTIGGSAFRYCTSLTTASFPVATSIGSQAFLNCTSLTTVSFPDATSIGNAAFRQCYNLKSLYLTGSSLCRLNHSTAFTSTPIGGYSTSAGTYGSIYVPTSLLTSYQTATNWTYFSSRFVGV